MESTKKLVLKNNISEVGKGVLVSVTISLVAILFFAVILRFVNFPDATIKIINQIIKILSILFGTKITLKRDRTKALIKGLLLGFVYTITSYLVFSILVSSFTFTISFLYDLIFASIVGLISSVIFTSIKK